MRITALSDLHGDKPHLPGGDLLVIAGDITARDTVQQWEEFYTWALKQPYQKRVFIAGNHDMFLTTRYVHSPKHLDRYLALLDLIKTSEDLHYLCDSGIKFGGKSIWGTPWSRWFQGINPSCAAFMLKGEVLLQDKFAKIPEDTDILVSHSPCQYRLDKTLYKEHAGSEALRDKVDQLRTKQLRLHVHGHIHEAYGSHEEGGLLTLNVSRMDRAYVPRNKIVNIEL